MKKCIVFLTVILSISTFLAQPRTPEDQENTGWLLVQNDYGILVNFREKGANNKHEVKAEAILKGNMDDAIAILSDPMIILATDPYVRNAVSLGPADSLGINYYYGELHTPFFLKEQDFVFKTYSSKTSSGYFIVWKSAYDELPEVPQFIRIKEISTIISLQWLSNEYYSLTYKISLAPEGGEMAATFADKALIESTIIRLIALRKLVLKKKEVQAVHD